MTTKSEQPPTTIAVEQIVEEYTPRLQLFIRRQVSNREDAEDVLQEVFYQLVRTTTDTTTQIEQLSAWLFRVARNTILNLVRKKHEDEWPWQNGEDEFRACEELSEVLFTDDNPTPDIVYLRSLVWEELEAALAELPPEQREVFELTVFEGMSMKEISQATDVSVPTLLSRKHYAVKFLRIRLGELYNDIIHY